MKLGELLTVIELIWANEGIVPITVFRRAFWKFWPLLMVLDHIVLDH